jgi:formate dehydrogenase iron-sulfur subunit
MAIPGLEIIQSSASLRGSATGVRKLPTVSKLIDTSTCIGCKACEVACQEWNDLPSTRTTQHGTYQTLPTMNAEFWNLIKFNEVEVEGNFAWLMRKDQCMHCADPGCLKACPAPGAIVQYSNGIVDVNPEQCIGCGLCETGCPFDVPRFSAKTGKMAKCTLCVDRSTVGLEPACVKACPTGCLHFGTKEDMLTLGKERVGQLKADGFANAGLYDPPGVGGTHVIAVRAAGESHRARIGAGGEGLAPTAGAPRDGCRGVRSRRPLPALRTTPAPEEPASSSQPPRGLIRKAPPWPTPSPAPPCGQALHTPAVTREFSPHSMARTWSSAKSSSAFATTPG